MNIKYFSSVILAWFISGIVGYGQISRIAHDPKYGADSASRIECASNLSIVNQYVKINTLEYAYDAWLSCYHNCPAASKNIYIFGAKILKYKIEKAPDEKTAQSFVDSLMAMYDQRIKYFKQPGYVYGLKGIDLLRYRKTALEEAYGYLEKSIDLREEEVDESVAVSFITTSYALLQENKIKPDQMVANYVKVSDLLNQKIKEGNSDQDTKLAIDNVEKIFAQSGAADCKSLVKIFTPQFQADSTNPELLKKITSMLDRTGCLTEDLYAHAAEALYKIEPSADAAAKLAKLFYSRQQYNKASQYFTKAISQETDNNNKAEYYYNLGLIAFQQKDYPAVRKYCESAIGLKSNYGDAYLLIGNAYAQSSNSCGNSDFEKEAVYWVAVDQFIKAKSVDPSVADKANDYIKSYSQHFPNNETAFFNGYTDGKDYKVGCWINETTKVRTIKTK